MVGIVVAPEQLELIDHFFLLVGLQGKRETPSSVLERLYSISLVVMEGSMPFETICIVGQSLYCHRNFVELRSSSRLLLDGLVGIFAGYWPLAGSLCVILHFDMANAEESAVCSINFVRDSAVPFLG
jgi:hypothetical protein